MIFMGDREEIWNFYTLTKKGVKRIKTGKIENFVKESKFLKKPLFF